MSECGFVIMCVHVLVCVLCVYAHVSVHVAHILISAFELPFLAGQRALLRFLRCPRPAVSFVGVGIVI